MTIGCDIPLQCENYKRECYRCNRNWCLEVEENNEEIENYFWDIEGE